MERYLISFDDGSMTFPEEELPAVGEPHIRWSGGSGGRAWVFGGGVASQRASVVATDGRSPMAPTRTKAVIEGSPSSRWSHEKRHWSGQAKFATACRCAQEVRRSCSTRSSDRREGRHTRLLGPKAGVAHPSGCGTLRKPFLPVVIFSSISRLASWTRAPKMVR